MSAHHIEKHNTMKPIEVELNTNEGSEIELEKGTRDPLKMKNIVLEEDFYALTWISLKWEIWNEKKIRGQNIFLSPADFFWIHMNFIIFLCLLILTVVLILMEILEERGYSSSNLPIIVLRLTLVCFAQRSLSPEFYQGLFLLRYSTRYPEKFSHYEFAVFVGACQLIVACTCFTGIMLFVCTAEEALDLVVEFAGISIIAKLDNWIGECIMLAKLSSEESEIEEDEYNLKNLNIRMSLSQKMALIEDEDLILVDDQNEIKRAPWILQTIDKIIHALPWSYILPFFTLAFNYLMPLIRPMIEEELEH